MNKRLEIEQQISDLLNQTAVAQKDALQALIDKRPMDAQVYLAVGQVSLEMAKLRAMQNATVVLGSINSSLIRLVSLLEGHLGYGE